MYARFADMFTMKPHNIPAGTKWEDLPEDWVCPLCGVGKDQFTEE